MNNKPLISVITVCFNSETTIKTTIESVLQQTYDNYEYIIIDGLSKDDTVSIAQSYSEAFAAKNIPYKIVSEKDNGIYDAMNKGIGFASGDIVGIINSDDFYEKCALEEVSKFYKETKFDIMYADLKIFGEGKEFVKKSKYTKKFNTLYWNHPTTFVTKEVYAKQRYACKNIFDDLNFMLSARTKGFKICILNKVLANFRLGGVSNKGTFAQAKARLRIRNSIYKDNGCKGYRLKNCIMEMSKYIVSRFLKK